MNTLTDYEQLAIHKMDESIHNGKWSNSGMVQLIEHINEYLNLKTIPDYAKENGMSYNGAKKCRKIIKLFNVKFIIDNE